MAKSNSIATQPDEMGIGSLYDYLPTPPQPRRKSLQRPPRACITVTDDWPEVVPITQAELRVIEGHFSDVLDKLFGPRA